jgi:hypothetical protein
VDLMRHAQLASLRSTPIRSEAAYAARPGSE